MRKIILALGAAFLCTNALAEFPAFPATVQIGGGAASNTLNQVSSFLATQLARNRDIKNVSDSRIAVASFVNMTSLDETDKLGMTLAENLMHEMYVRGFGVVDFKARKAMPRAKVRGIIARTYFYMSDRYALRLSRQERQLFGAWSRQYPVSTWERQRNQQLACVMGWGNPHVGPVDLARCPR